MANQFNKAFRALTGHSPFPWQARLFKQLCECKLPAAVDIPTGLGKTAVMAIWLLARAAGAELPRRLVYVVDRRAVVDQATDFAEKIRSALDECKDLETVRRGLKLGEGPLAISTLRGQHADNREWLSDPTAPAIIVGTVDMIGSRLLFEGYGVSRKMRPYAAGLMGCDTLVLLDEAHLSRPFEQLLRTIEREQQASVTGNGKMRRGYFAGSLANAHVPPPFRMLPLSATLGDASKSAQTFSLNADDRQNAVVRKRLEASKTLTIEDLSSPANLEQVLAEKAWELACNQAEAQGRPVRMLIYSDRRTDAEKIAGRLQKLAKDESPKAEVILFVGGRRIYERMEAAKQLQHWGFIAHGNAGPSANAFLVATSAGEVGVDLDADHMVCDLVPWERMVQRLGRVNRRGDGAAQVVVVNPGPPEAKQVGEASVVRHKAARALLEKLPQPDEHGHQANPASLIGLRINPELGQLIDNASTTPPLYPALSRPLVDAWSMTSLAKHSGRPEVGPWLRGWVDEKPQTTLIWRRHLPVRSEKPSGLPCAMTDKEVDAFFEAAAPQVTEQLESETRRVVDWLKKRTRKRRSELNKQQEIKPELGKEDSVGEPHARDFMPPLTLQGPIGFILRDVGCPEPLCLQSIHDSNPRELNRKLNGQKLVLDARLSGLSEGLLSDSCNDAVLTIDDNWGNADVDERDQRRMRIQVINDSTRNQRLIEHDQMQEGDESPLESWREALAIPCRLSVDRSPQSWLVVEKWRDAEGDEETRALAPVGQSLKDHQEWTGREAARIAEALGLSKDDRAMLEAAASHHDDGKAAHRWQRAFNAPKDSKGPYAKTPGPLNRQLLNGYRHEFQSVIDAENKGLNGLDRNDLRFDLALHLIAAHHGHARPTIPIEGCDSLPPTAAELRAHEVALRFARLQQQLGPWGLAWWEALLRAADQRASKALVETVRWQTTKTPPVLASQGIQRDMFTTRRQEAS